MPLAAAPLARLEARLDQARDRLRELAQESSDVWTALAEAYDSTREGRPGCPPTAPSACTRAGTAVPQSGARRARLSMATTRLAAVASAKIRSQTLPPMGAVWNASFITGR